MSKNTCRHTWTDPATDRCIDCSRMMKSVDELKQDHNGALHDSMNFGEVKECPYCNGSDDDGNTWGADDEEENFCVECGGPSDHDETYVPDTPQHCGPHDAVPHFPDEKP